MELEEEYHIESAMDFIGIGTPKAATSWIFKCLEEHPQICGTSPKETGFFFQHRPEPKKIDQFFKHCNNSQLRGEFTVGYFHTPEVPARIKELCPNAKLILCLRHPVDRIISEFYYHHSMEKLKERKDVTSPKGTIWQQIQSSPETTLHIGLYATHLKRWLKYFDREDIYVFSYEDIQRDPQAVVKNLYLFLGVNPSFVPSTITKKVNVTVKSKAYVPKLRSYIFSFRRTLKKKKLGRHILRLVYFTRLNKLGGYLLHINQQRGARGRKKLSKNIHPDTLSWLKKYYDPDINELEKLLGWDLSHWK